MSRNGVFLNRSEQPLGYCKQAQLNDGDEVTIATYRLLVRLRDRVSHPVPGRTSHRGDGASQLPPQQVNGARTMPGPSIDNPSAELAILAAEPRQSAPSNRSAMDDPAAGHAASVSKDSGAGPVSGGAESTSEDTGEHMVADPNQSQSGSDIGEALAELISTGTLERSQFASLRTIHVDKEKLCADGHLPPKTSERLISNQIRHIKRPLIKNALGKGVERVPNGHLIMVTSSLPGEGKTFSSINLALSIAREKDLEVVLIDADVAKRDVSHIFGVTENRGLLDALADDLIDVESLILPTDVKGLSLLPAGYCAEEDASTELLASSRMDEVAARIGSRSAHRIALFDSPPLLLTNESRVLASLMGHILLVVRAGETPRQAVQEAIGYLDDDKPLGLVLNQSKAGRPGSYYGYGAYGYGTYGAETEGKAADRKHD